MTKYRVYGNYVFSKILGEYEAESEEEAYFYNSLWNDLRYESKENCISAAESKIDELVK